jgi:predicted PurR-regulated permease PerM
MSWRFLAIAGFAAILIWLAFLLGTVTASVIVALIIAALFVPLMRRLMARGWSRGKAAGVVTLAAFALGAGALVLLILAVLPEVRGFVATVEEGITELENQIASGAIETGVGHVLTAAITSLWTWFTTQVGGLVGTVASAVTIGILALFLTFFVLSDGSRAQEWALQGAPSRHRQRIRATFRDALARVGGYLRGTAMVALVLVLSFGAFGWLFGLPHVAPLAGLAVLGGFVPYIGGIVAMLIALLVGLGSVTPPAVLGLAVLMLAAIVIAERFVRPAASGRSIKFHPAVVLIALPIGAAAGGVIGFIVVLPITAVIMVVARVVIDALEPEEPSETDREVPGWFDRLAQWSWRSLAVIGAMAIVVFLVGLAPLVVAPIIMATVVAATIAPLAGRLRARGWNETWAALAVTGGAFLAIMAIIAIALAQLAEPIGEAIQAAIDASGQLSDDAGGTLAWIQPVVSAVSGELRRALSAVFEAIAVVGLVFVLAALLSFFFVRDAGRAWRRLLKLANPWRRESLDGAGRQSVDILGSYMFGTAAISAVGAISQAVIMLILGLPLVVPIAVLSFILAFIPYIGGFITTGLAFLVAVQFGTPTQIGIMFVWTIVFNLVQGNIVTPLVYNRAVNLHPAVVLLAVPAGSAIAGIAGMFLAVPILAIVAATWRTILKVLGDDPGEVPTSTAPVAGPVQTAAAADG